MSILGTLLKAVAVLTLLCTSSLYAREMRALVVGVSEYPGLGKDFQLRGPRNDVVRLRNVLKQRGFADTQVKVLADGVADAALPTRHNILAELERIAKSANRDDFVLLYFAGHGSQQPADRSTPEGQAESDGMFEIFLPRDVGKWSGSLGRVENALVKTELRAAVDKILATGAFVWGVFDSCHSATLVRGAASDMRYRYVDPAMLGVPDVAQDLANPARANSRGGPATPANAAMPLAEIKGKAGDGGSVFFYAAQTRESTPEMLLPLGHPQAKQYGLFGFMVMEALGSGAPMTYRQMAQYVLTRYAGMNESRVTPLFSGTALDQSVLQQKNTSVRQWQIERGSDLVVQAGALDNLTQGSIVAVMADPLAKTAAAVSYLQLTEVGLASSVAVPIAYAGKPVLNPELIAKGSFARAVETVPDYTLRVSVDAGECARNCQPKSVVDRLRASKQGIPGTAITWVDAPAVGDVMLKLLPDRILLLPPSMQGANCAGAAGECRQSAAVLLDKTTQFDKSMQARLAQSLHAVARTTNLMRIAARQSTAGSNNSRLDVSVSVLTADGRNISYQSEQVPQLHAGDRISVSLKNKGLKSTDVTLLYVDARYGVNVLFPAGAGASNRLEPGAGHEFEMEVTDETLGMERMLTIAVEAGKTQERTDFSFLAQSSLAASRAITARGDDADILAFMDAGFSDFKTRSGGVVQKAPSSRTAMQVFTFQIAK